jgi:hypothetical protein
MEINGQLHVMPHYSRGKRPMHPLDRRLGGPQSQYGRFGEMKILDSTGTRTPTSVAIPTELPQLLENELLTSVNSVYAFL